MNKISLYIFVFLTIISCSNIYSQQEQSVECGIFLEPIIGFNISLGENKSDVLKRMKDFSLLEGEVLKYLPKDVIGYKAKNKITLPNGYKTEATFNLKFKKDVLINYGLRINIGDDYNRFWDIIDYIRELDKENINSFIYSSKRFMYISKEGNCNKRFKVNKSVLNAKIFEINCSVY